LPQSRRASTRFADVSRGVERSAQQRTPTFAIFGAGQYPFAVGQPEDIANVALFLASDESRMVNGAAIPAEGGFSAY
jgi:NAD(P)-dependent dehydrogenase (short-subunit alcohol dehydrogenase family)